MTRPSSIQRPVTNFEEKLIRDQQKDITLDPYATITGKNNLDKRVKKIKNYGEMHARGGATSNSQFETKNDSSYCMDFESLRRGGPGEVGGGEGEGGGGGEGRWGRWGSSVMSRNVVQKHYR